MPNLIITEKTNQARDLRAALGDRFGQILPAACVLLKPERLYPTKLATEGNKPAKLIIRTLWSLEFATT